MLEDFPQGGWGYPKFSLLSQQPNLLSGGYRTDIVVGNTQSDSIQYLNFVKKWFIQYSIQYHITHDSIKNIIQFKENSAESIQKMIQFNSQGVIDTGRIGKVSKNSPKSVHNRQKGGFLSKMESIDLKYDSFIHFTIKLNSKD